MFNLTFFQQIWRYMRRPNFIRLEVSEKKLYYLLIWTGYACAQTILMRVSAVGGRTKHSEIVTRVVWSIFHYVFSLRHVTLCILFTLLRLFSLISLITFTVCTYFDLCIVFVILFSRVSSVSVPSFPFCSSSFLSGFCSAPSSCSCSLLLLLLSLIVLLCSSPLSLFLLKSSLNLYSPCLTVLVFVLVSICSFYLSLYFSRFLKDTWHNETTWWRLNQIFEIPNA